MAKKKVIRNPVARNSGFNRAATYTDRKKEQKRGVTKHKGNLV